MKIFHVADLHLGRRRLDERLPDQDLADALRFVAERAVEEKADVFLIAGDLFDRPQVDPPHLRQAQRILRVLHEARIPVLAVEGNHDKTSLHSSAQTWVQFLAHEGLLKLLRPSFGADGAALEAWGEEKQSGAFVDLDGVRFIGAGYLGAATPAKMRQILARIEAGRANVLLLHAGPDYFVGEGGGFSKDDLAAIEEKVCYLALGHMHKPMRHGDWACNPGSTENCDVHEASYDRDRDGNPVGRGYAVVEIDPRRPERPLKIDVRSNPRRTVLRIELDCTPFGNKLKNGAEAFVAAASKAIGGVGPGPESLIDLQLTGNLNLDRISLDPQLAADEIARASRVFAVSVDTRRINVGGGFASADSAGDVGIPRDELERRAIHALVEKNQLWGLDAERDQFTDLFYQLKESVRTGRSSEEIIEQLASSPLVEAIRATTEVSAAVTPSVEEDEP